MTRPYRHLSSRLSRLSRMPRHRWLLLGVFVVFAGSFVAYVQAEQRIDRAHEARAQSFMLAEQLRRSTDELSRMVRTYIATGNESYKRQYEHILDVRDGRQPRPLDRQDLYWERGDAGAPGGPGPAVPLMALVEGAGFPDEELARLRLAKANSDALSRTEYAAMAVVESVHPPSEALRARATAMLHDPAYYQAKANIIDPINQFEELASRRTARGVDAAKELAMFLLFAFVGCGWLGAALLLGRRRKLHDILGGPASELHRRIALLGGGDFTSPIAVREGMQDSVLGWLSETQHKLAAVDAQHRAAEARNARLTQLYAALIQCNQALVRCANAEALFDQLCRVIVNYGGMTMAWVGELDETGTQIIPVASFGGGTAFLEGLRIPLDQSQPFGRGPTGSAFRDEVPCWCQDFQHDPATSDWHAAAARFGWAASGALPLRLRGSLTRVLTLYAERGDAFDDDARELLLEMATDIAYALRGFERDAQRQSAAEALQRSEHRMRMIIETEPECIKVVDSAGNLLEMNPAGLKMLGAQTLEQVQERRLAAFIVPQYREAFGALHKGVIGGGSGTLEFEIVALDGTARWLETHAAPLKGVDGEGTLLLGITRDITARKHAEQQIQFLAQFDALTGLPNRTQLDSRASYAIGLAQRSMEPVAVMFLGLDHFKDINDSLGHGIGDRLLVETAVRLRQVLRVQDTLSRFGGDEFIFLLYGVNARAAGHIARKVLSVIAEPYRIDEHDLNVTGSIGIALYPEDGTELDTLSRSADAAMVQVKQDGRNGYRFFTAEMQIRSARHLQLVHALRQALERKQLRVHYQPQISMLDGSIIGAEALLRWTHPELGAVSPGEFIPAAEDSGLILPIGEWVLREAVRQATRWIEAGVPPMVMAVNLSAVQFRHPDLPNLVTRILDEEGLPAEYLELELTEGVAMHDPQGAIAMMNKLHERGVRMSIDDFGTGYSSLSHLKKFKVYKLKIDQSFVRDISTDPEDRAIVGAIINMAKSLGLQTIAEGVETAGQLTFLREQGCDEMQGYYYSKPLAAEQFEALVRSGHRIDPR